MFDAALRNIIDPPLNAIGTRIAAIGVSANAVTVFGFLLGLLAVPLIAIEQYGAALILILMNRLFDGLDGAVARHSLLTDFGGYLDIICDFIFYSAVVFGFALASSENALYAAFLIFSFMGTASTFLTYAIMAEKHGISTDIQGRKSLYYLGGLAEGGETIAAMLLMCIFPNYFMIVALVFGSMCWVTTITRIYAAWLTFGKSH
ncbi:CDP-alcohol phosphatidyltransferase family protein [Sneathiella sp. HT1-7]|uniref:CDP-alcohol phosphatidyltransferase family protein n=1 Tax=Sneathiella sp. HT1-7 TaxID=2887192 RepID=UPI001D143438|nr:CDP-alcohol phosphatidyltransferase family protein [Sneathiella sp. HT1-7]MCC3304392.1 CDP-alcohol phosphatidyltransferase family protein [Sneathiella sp. HT1-7]